MLTPAFQQSWVVKLSRIPRLIDKTFIWLKNIQKSEIDNTYHDLYALLQNAAVPQITFNGQKGVCINVCVQVWCEKIILSYHDWISVLGLSCTFFI